MLGLLFIPAPAALLLVPAVLVVEEERPRDLEAVEAGRVVARLVLGAGGADDADNFLSVVPLFFLDDDDDDA